MSEQISARGLFLQFLVFFTFAVGMYGVGTSWVHNSFLAAGDISITISIWVTVLFVFANAGLFTVVMVIVQAVWVRLPRFVNTGKNSFTLNIPESTESRRYSLIGVVLAWILFELLHTMVESEIAFPWLQAGYAFIDTWLVGLATVGGVTLVSFFVLLSAMALYRIRRIRLITMVLAICPWLLGIGLLNISWTQPIAEKEIVLVQSNLSIAEKMDEYGPTRSWRTLVSLSLEEVGADFVIWPEGAIVSRLNQELLNALYSFANNIEATVILGMFIQVNYGDDEEVLHNIAVGVSKHAPEHEEYKKLKMVPFGEKIPFEPILGPIVRWLEIPIRSIESGREQQSNMNFNGVSVGVTICYEIAFPSYIAARSRNADFLVTLSEDGWFGNSIGPAQHMQIARMRAVETGRYLARATSKGISGIVDPKGRVIATMPANEPGVVRGTIKTMEGETWFVRYLSGLSGWVWGALVVLGGGALSAFGGVLGLLFLRQVFAREARRTDEEVGDTEEDVSDEDEGTAEND